MADGHSEPYGDENDEALLPRFFYNTITDITPDALREMGAEAVAIDIDNTIANDGAFHLFHGVRAWVKRMQEEGFGVIILTNTYPMRAKFISRVLGRIPYIANAKKPSRKGYRQAAEILGVPVEKIAMVGDQLFTDIKGANRAGAIPVHVKYRHREILLYFHYRRLRRHEKRILAKKGYGDKYE